MKKKIVCLMIACLSLFVCPQIMKAGTDESVLTKTEAAIDPTATGTLMHKLHEMKAAHSLLHKKDVLNNESGTKREPVTVVYISGAALLLIIILLILLL